MAQGIDIRHDLGLGGKSRVREGRGVGGLALLVAGRRLRDLGGGVHRLRLIVACVSLAGTGGGHGAVVVGPGVGRLAPVVAQGGDGHGLLIRVVLCIQAVCRGDGGGVHSRPCSRAGRSIGDRSHVGVDRFGGTIGTGVIRDRRGITVLIAAGPGEAIEGVGYRLRRSVVFNKDIDLRSVCRAERMIIVYIALGEVPVVVIHQIILIGTRCGITVIPTRSIIEPEDRLLVRSVMPVLPVIGNAGCHSEGSVAVGIQILAAVHEPYEVRIGAAGVLHALEDGFLYVRG